jgi:hypothetical protein
LISEAQRRIDRQWQEGGELSLYLTAVLVVLSAAAVFVLPEAEHPSAISHLLGFYATRLEWQGAEISLLWAALTIWMSLFPRPLAIGADVSQLHRSNAYHGPAEEFKDLLYGELDESLRVNHDRYQYRRRRFYSGHALVCSAVFFLAVALPVPLDFLKDVPLVVMFLAADWSAFSFSATLHRNVGYDFPLSEWVLHWAAPSLLLLFFGIGPVLLATIDLNLLVRLQTWSVVGTAVALYLLVVGGIWTAAPVRAAFRNPSPEQSAKSNWQA